MKYFNEWKNKRKVHWEKTILLMISCSWTFYCLSEWNSILFISFLTPPETVCIGKGLIPKGKNNYSVVASSIL